jgi:hypothetical protein
MAYTDEFGNIYEDDSLSGDSGSDSGGSGFFDFTGGESQDYDLTSSEALAGQGFLQDEVGNYYKLDSSGNLTFKDSTGTDFTYNTEKGGFTDSAGNFAGGNSITDYIKKYGSKALDLLKTNGKYDIAKLGALGLGAYSLMNQDKQGGYNKPVPKMDMVRDQIQYNDPNRRPGESGRQYFTDPRFAAQGNAEALAAAKAASAQQASGLQAAMQAAPAPAPNPYAGKMKMAYNPQPVTNTETTGAGLPQIPTSLTAQGGIPMAAGGLADAGRYLQGETDGMADKIPSSIDGEQPAALSHGEFVIPADVVSHLGNGNSDAGAQKLYEMMNRIRQARTGTTEQGKEINPDEFTMGGLAAAYAGGGAVKGFSGADGVSAVSGPVTPAPAQTAAGIPQDVSRTSTLSPWVGDYVTNALGQGAAMAAAPYQAYQGPLTAGASNLQQQAFAGGSEMAQAGYNPAQFAGGFNAQTAQQYMNPYLQASLDPQLKELQRQSEIARIGDAGRLTRAGAFGGSRQAIMESEGRRNLLDKQQDVLGQGYKSAYDMGLGQFNKEREADEASRQFGANFGMKSVDMLSGLGAIERGITSEGLAADKAQFEEQRDFAYGMPKYQLGLLSGLPIGANTTSVDQDALGRLQTQISGLGTNYTLLDKALKALGQTPT